ncbi:MAG: low molecular weight protein-tyrosine-phosphatase [Roseburia sp.]
MQDKIKVLFICHGNICRSPMAEFILKDMVHARGIADEFSIASAAMSNEEIGNGIYPPAKAELARHGIGTERLRAEVAAKTARRIRRSDYGEYDYLIAMEHYNIRNMMREFGEDSDNKICRLLDFTDRPGDIADPWYTRRFDVTYDEIVAGCEAFLERVLP